MAARENDKSKPQPIPSQCVDRSLLDASKTGFQVPGRDRIHLCRPSYMEYTPAPLSFVCRTCGVFKDFDNLNALDAALPTMNSMHCQNPKRRGDCDWEQLDVVFVHWSGRWEAPFPGQYNWNPVDNRVAKFRSRCTCGSSVFRLNRRAPGIGDWFFECAACDTPLSAKWLQNDKDTLEMIGSGMSAQRLTEVRMQATPYRASSTYYVKTDLFIDFKTSGQQLLACLRPNREEDLKSFIAAQYGFEVGVIVSADADLSHAPTMRWPTWNGPRYISHAGRSSLAMGQRWTGMWVIAALASTWCIRGCRARRFRARGSGDARSRRISTAGRGARLCACR